MGGGLAGKPFTNTVKIEEHILIACLWYFDNASSMVGSNMGIERKLVVIAEAVHYRLRTGVIFA